MNCAGKGKRKRSASIPTKKSGLLEQQYGNLCQQFLNEVKGNRGARLRCGRGKENKQIKNYNELMNMAVKFKNISKESKQSESESLEEQRLLQKYANINILKNVENNWTQSNHNIEKNDLLPVNKVQHGQKWSIMQNKVKKQCYLSSFKEAVFKIFKGLDIFNRGVIAQTNINKWIPEQALYFLGNVFQKIREERLTLSCQQFFKKCLPILQDSTEQDLKQFLTSVSGQDALPASTSVFSQDKAISQVQMRIGMESKGELCASGSYKPLIPFSEIMENIRQKQKKICLKLTDRVQSLSKQKPATNPLSYLHKGCKINSKATGYEIISNQGDKQKDTNFSVHGQQKAKMQQSQQFLPCFNFKLAQFDRVVEERKQKTNLKESCKFDNLSVDNPKRREEKEENAFDITFKHIENIQVPRTSRIVHQKMPKEVAVECKTQRKGKTDADRIDRLSSRLQEYIRFNRQKIEKNDKFIRQNSVPKCLF